MARPKSDERRSAILTAAIRVIASEGLGASTAAIAKEAGISNGSLFTYFETKADLLNALYIEIKTEIAEASLSGLPVKSSVRNQMHHMWSRWLSLAVASPEKRRAFACLSVSDEITPASRELGHQVMAGVARLLEQSRKQGPMRKAPLAFVSTLMNALADATTDFMINDPANADKHRETGFEAMWRMLA